MISQASVPEKVNAIVFYAFNVHDDLSFVFALEAEGCAADCIRVSHTRHVAGSHHFTVCFTRL